MPNFNLMIYINGLITNHERDHISDLYQYNMGKSDK